MWFPDTSRTAAILADPRLRGAPLVVDATGMGRPVLDMLEAAGGHPTSVTITAGDSVTSEGNHYRVPKRDLVSTVQVLLQSDRLKIAEALPAAETLVQGLLAFQVRITASAHDVYGAWQEGSHGDLVLDIALACWWSENDPVRGWIRLLEKGFAWLPVP